MYKDLNIMNNKLLPFILVGMTALTACDQNQSDTSLIPKVLKKDAVAVVNGTYISKTALTALEKEITQRSQGRSFPKEKILEELIQREILLQEAINKQIDKSPEFAERLDNIKKSLLAQATVQDFMKTNPLTDAELEAEYNKKIGESGTEYKARHILVKTEEESKKIIAELDKGADFIELAKNKSTGPSGPKGGDLGWFAAGQMVAPFSEATIALENGKHTTEAVQTQFGWHIILREDSRTQTPPAFDTVKEQIRPTLQRKKMQDYLDNLRQQAKVEILMPEPAAELKASEAVKTAIEATKSTENKTVEKVANKVQTTTEDATNAVTETMKKANEMAKESASKALDTSAKDNITNKVQATTQDAKNAISETIKKAKDTVKEGASKATDTATKKLDALTQ